MPELEIKEIMERNRFSYIMVGLFSSTYCVHLYLVWE